MGYSAWRGAPLQSRWLLMALGYRRDDSLQSWLNQAAVLQRTSVGPSHVLNPDLTYGSRPELYSLDSGVVPESRTTRKKSSLTNAAKRKQEITCPTSSHSTSFRLSMVKSCPVQSAVCTFCGQASDILLTSPDHNAQGDSQLGQR